MSRKKQQPLSDSKPKDPRFGRVSDQYRVSLTHCVRTQHTGAAFSVYNFDCLQLTTLQPYLRDQILAIWSKYVVMHVELETRIVNRSTTVDAEIFQYYGTGTTVSALSLAQVLEYKHCQKRMLTSSGNGKTITIRTSVPLHTLLKARYDDDSDFWGTASANPSYCSTADSIQAATGIIAADGTSSVTLTMDRKLIFHVKFFGLTPAPNSVHDQQPLLIPDLDVEEWCFEKPESVEVLSTKNVTRLASNPKVVKGKSNPGR